MERLPRSEWIEACEMINGHIDHGLRLVDLELRPVVHIDFAPLEDTMEVDVLTAGHIHRLLFDHPNEMLVTEENTQADTYLILDGPTDSIELRVASSTDHAGDPAPPDLPETV